jgi:CRP-like cAMP-binding protein
MINDADVALLHALFPNATVEALLQAAQDSDVQFFPPGGTVVADAERSDSFYVVADGLLRLSVSQPSGSTPVAYVERGQYFGKKSLGGEHPTAIMAMRETRLIRMPDDTYRRLLA